MRYQRIVFMQNSEDSAEPLRILDQDGPEAAIEYLAQWDNGDAGEEFDEPASGGCDDVFESDDGYRLTWNNRLGYIGLERIVADELGGMTLRHPFKIAPNLQPGLHVGGAWLTLEMVGVNVAENRCVYRWTIVLPDGQEFSEADLQSGACATEPPLQGMFGDLLAFLGAAVDSYDWRQRTGKQGENEDLFPPAVVEWASQHDDELSMLAIEIEETPDLIVS